MKIGLVSDTHNHFDPALNQFFADRDEIWHAGDLGSWDIALKLQNICPQLIGVYGNIDGPDVRKHWPERQVFYRQGLCIAMIHIGGYPKRYAKGINTWLKELKPQIFITGHSHILKILPDTEIPLLHLNPGAFGLEGWHQRKTCLRFELKEGKIENMEVLDKAK